jgi:hypothetical protein
MRKIFFTVFILLVLFLASGIYAQPTSAPNLLTPPDNATGVSLFPTFTWSAVSGATSYRLQIYTGPTLVIDIPNITGTSYTLTQAVLTGNTYYYWTVAAVNGGGQGPWASYFHFTTAPAAPSAPTLFAPTNNSVDVPLTPTLDWYDVNGADQYRVQIATDSNFNNIVVNVGGLTNSAYVVQSGALINNTLYYWKVNAKNTGGESPWSVTWHFTTIPAVPSAPTLLTPGNGSINVTQPVVLDWNDVPTATGYRAQVSQNGDFTQIVFDDISTTSTITVPAGTLSGTTTYFWRVSASNVAGYGGWSPVWNFTTALAPPGSPLLLVPVNTATGVAINNVLFDWNSVSGATSYRIQISTSSNFGTTFVNTTVANSQYTHTSPNFAYNTLYYWRVYATNAGGNSLWSQVWSFTTIEATLSPPTLVSPPNNSVNISLTPTLSWTEVTGATGYQLQVSTSSSFSSFVLNITVTGTSYTIPSGILQGYTVYYWRVASRNAGGQGSFTASWNFRTVQTFNLSLSVLLEGFWNGTTHVPDTVKVLLAQNISPFAGRDTSLSVIGTNGQTSLISFARATSGNYYIIVKHRNHIETWSANAMYFSTGNTVNYDFTNSSSKAYGNNMKQVGSVWVLYGGDGNGDGFVNSADYELYKTQFGMWGYKSCDYNGDWFIDGYDYPIQYNNFGKSVIKPTP